MIIRKCKTKGAYEAIPDNNMNLDFNKLRKFEIITELPILIIIKCENVDVTCYKNGKLLMKIDDENKAKEIAEKIYGALK